jgi:unsaturated chondroitin disaccharide hydrolase
VTAERAADWYIAHVPPDGVPYWDLRHPQIPFVERDASAGAIAASGLLDLANRVDTDKAARYRRVAERIIRTLGTGYLTVGTPLASILQHSVGNYPQNGEVDVGIVYADYYFVEALLRLRGTYLQ